MQFINTYYEEGKLLEAYLTKLLHLEEKSDEVIEIFFKHQGIVKRWFDNKARVKAFRITNLVFYWDKTHKKKGGHKKIEKLWLGCFQISEILGDNAFLLKTLIGEDVPLLVNGKYLKHYFLA